MKKKNNHRFKAAPSLRDREPRFLFDLSTKDGLTMARCFAISHGIQSAFEEKKAGLALDTGAREAGAISGALLIEQIKYQGKRGAKQPVEFRQLFRKLATRMHEAMIRYMEEEPQIYLQLSRMTPEQLNKQALITAEKYVEQICATPDNVPITMTWF